MKKIDLLFMNLSNFPERPVYPYAFVQVSALARKAGLSIERWDGLDLSREHQHLYISQLLEQYEPRVIGFTIRQADSTVGSDYLDEVTGLHKKDAWFPMEDTYTAIQHIRTLSKATIMIGGFTFTVAPESTMQYFQADLGILGEADDFFANFEAVLAGNYASVANLIYPDKDGWKQNQRVFFPPCS